MRKNKFEDTTMHYYFRTLRATYNKAVEAGCADREKIPIYQGLLSRAGTWMWRILYQWFQRYVFSWPLFPWLLWWLVLFQENRGCSKTCIRNCRTWGGSDCKSHRWSSGRLYGRAWRWRHILFFPWVHCRRRLTKKWGYRPKMVLYLFFLFSVCLNSIFLLY